ncbi:MAG: C40 family peptidase [Lachnospiraceae bacterium]|nr:C40 family peptidase [Lachnospiraceae bacterium]
MQIRQKEETRDIDTRDVNLRAVGKTVIWVQRGASSSAKYGSTVVRGGRRGAGTPASAVKYASFLLESRAALSSLSREQKKQWDSYSQREQMRILAVVEKKVERRTRYQSSGVAETQKPVYQNREVQQNSIYQKQDEVSLAYRISDTGQRRIQNRTGWRGQSIRLTGMAVEGSIEYGATAQKRRSDRSVLESQDNPNVEKKLVKQSGGEEIFRMPVKIRRVDDDAFSVHHSHTDQIGGSLQRSQSFRTDQTEQGSPPDKGELVVGWDTNKGMIARKAGAILTERKLLQDKADIDEEIFFETGESFSQQSESPFFSGQWSGQDQAIPPAAVNVGEIRTSSEHRRIRKAKGDEVFVYINPHVSGETLEFVRRSQAMKNIQQEKTPPPRITGAFQRVSMSQDNAGIQGIRLQKMVLVQREERRITSMGEVLQKELDRLSGRSQAHRREGIGSIRKNSRERDARNPDAGDAVYMPYVRKTTQKEAIFERRKEKELTKEVAAEKMLFVRELGSLLNQDARKREAVKKMQLEEMIGQAELERETAADVIRTAGLPARIRIAQIKAQLQQKLVGAAAGLGKYLAIFGGVVFMLLFLIAFFAILFGSLAGEEEENSTQYSVSGSEIVEYAQSWIGITQYSYGAGRGSAIDWQDYSDCSSFVHGVFNHFGIETGWTTTAMEDDGTLVEGGISDALPGDIILFYTGSVHSGGSSHVGIYAGNGMMVHNSVSRGVCMSSVASDGRPYVVRRIVTGTTSGNSTDNTAYTQAQMETIWAIVCQEDGGSYAGALAVISTAMNRVDSAQWSYLGSNAYAQLTAPGQFCYSIDTYWQRYLNGNVPDYVKQAVSDCLENGIRNHTYTSFRSYYTEGSVQIGGGNYYFG